MKTKTELDLVFEAKDDPDFTRSFRRDFLICVAIGLMATIGLIAVVVNASSIDLFFSEIVKKMFL